MQLKAWKKINLFFFKNPDVRMEVDSFNNLINKEKIFANFGSIKNYIFKIYINNQLIIRINRRVSFLGMITSPLTLPSGIINIYSTLTLFT